MAAFDQLLGRGYELRSRVIATATITVNEVSATVVSSPLKRERVLMETGYKVYVHGMVEMTRADFMRLGIKDRTVLTYTSPADDNQSEVLYALDIENDGADPTITFRVEREQGGKAG